MQIRNDAPFYASLGLVANPFVPHPEDGLGLGGALEVTAAANKLLASIVASAQGGAQAIVVDKSRDIPSYYPLRAVGHVESMLINDERLNVLHAYIQLYMLRRGRIRSTLGVVGERLAFRSFENTLAALVERVLASPDETLGTYEALGEDTLAAFMRSFAEDPVGTVITYFGDAELERRPELAEVVDIRLASLDADTVEDESAQEVDATVGMAPGTGVALTAGEQSDEERDRVVAYIVEYVERHLSTVLARALKMYRERGLAALSTELKVTKAPRKTLQAVVDLATTRFAKVAIIYDGFENWESIEPDTAGRILGAFEEMGQLLDGRATMCFLLERGVAQEVRRAFPDAQRVDWDFANLVALQSLADELDPAIAQEWIGAATLPGATPLTLEDGVLAQLHAQAGGSLDRFARMAGAAIDDAAERGATRLDAAALDAGLRAETESGEER